VKLSNNMVASLGFWPGRWVNPPGHTGFFLSLFFLQTGPVPAPGWPAGPGFKTMLEIHQNNIFFYFFKFIFDISTSKRSENIKKLISKKSKISKSASGYKEKVYEDGKNDRFLEFWFLYRRIRIDNMNIEGL